MKEKHILNLNNEQLKSVKTTEGAVMVVAGPGTGKTQVMGARIAEILQNHDISPANILCLTYTEAATISLTNRLVSFIGSAAHQVAVQTYHGFANKVIQENAEYFKTKELEPASDLEILEIIHEIIEELPKGHALKNYTYLYGNSYALKKLFETIKSENLTIQGIEQQASKYLDELLLNDGYTYKKKYKDKNVGEPTVKYETEQKQVEKLLAAVNLFPKYEKKMMDKGRYQFADMLIWTYDLFCQHPDVLARYQEQYQYILVDEFQDTNGIQLAVLYKLIEYWDNPNIFIVGDDDQSIYKFQGASVENIINFYEKYQQYVTTIVLKTNYRSFQEILNASAALINHNNERIVKQLSFVVKDIHAFFEPEGEDRNIEQVAIEAYPNEFQEAVGIAEAIEALKQKNVPLDEIAIIYHQHKHVELIQRYFNHKKIPYQTSRKINILEEPNIRFLISLMQYFEKEKNLIHSGESLLYSILHQLVFHLPSLEISEVIHHLKKDRLRLRGQLSTTSEILLQKPEIISAFKQFETNTEKLAQDLQQMSFVLWLEKVLHQYQIIPETLKSEEAAFQMQCLYSFFEFIKTENGKKNMLSIQDLLTTLDKMQKEQISLPVNKILQGERGVNFTTAHSSKGLEYDYVFIIKAADKYWFPRQPNTQFNVLKIFQNEPQKLDEEEKRRLFFVAMTRAKKALNISYSILENDKPIIPVRFINEIKTHYPNDIKQRTVSDYEGVQFLQHSLSSFPQPIEAELKNSSFVNQKIEQLVMDATKLNAYLRCPVAFFYDRMLQIPSAMPSHAVLGTAVHKTMDWCFNHRTSNGQLPELEAILSTFSKEIFRFAHVFPETEIKIRIEQGELALEKFLPIWKEEWAKIPEVKTEFQTKVVFEDIPIRGDVDRIDLHLGRTEIVEYKTGSVGKTKEKVKVGNTVFIENPEEVDKNDTTGGDHWRQVYLYKLLTELDPRIGTKPETAAVYYLEEEKKENQVQRITFNFEEMELVKNQLRTVYSKIKNKEFDQGCNNDYCQWCNFKKSVQ